MQNIIKLIPLSFLHHDNQRQRNTSSSREAQMKADLIQIKNSHCLYVHTKPAVPVCVCVCGSVFVEDRRASFCKCRWVFGTSCAYVQYMYHMFQRVLCTGVPVTAVGVAIVSVRSDVTELNIPEGFRPPLSPLLSLVLKCNTFSFHPVQHNICLQTLNSRVSNVIQNNTGRTRAELFSSVQEKLYQISTLKLH